MKKLEKRVEKELVDILYSIDKSMNDNLYPITIRIGKLSIEFHHIMNPEYFFNPPHNILILNELIPVLNITLKICEHDYMVKSLNFIGGQGLLEKRKLIKLLKTKYEKDREKSER